MAALSHPFAPLFDAVLFDHNISRSYKAIHAYCIKRLQIENWRISKKDIADRFNNYPRITKT
jgi:hypothetical protein